LTKQLEGERGERAQLERDIEHEKEQQSSPALLSFILSPISVRDSGGAKRLVIPKSAPAILLQLDIGAEEYKTIRAELRTAEGREVWSQKNLKARRKGSGNSLFLKLNSDLLKSDDYIIKLSEEGSNGELEEITEYSFSVLKK